MLICTHKTIVLYLRFRHNGKSPRISSSTKAGRRFDYVAHAQNVRAGKFHFRASSSSISLSMLLKFTIMSTRTNDIHLCQLRFLLKKTVFIVLMCNFIFYHVLLDSFTFLFLLPFIQLVRIKFCPHHPSSHHPDYFFVFSRWNP